MWNNRYNQDDYAFGKQANDFLVEQYLHIPSGGRVLCLAEGEGRNAVFLAEQGFEVIGVDLSPVGLEKAQKLADEKGVSITTEVANLNDYDLGEDKWDAVISIWAHMPKPVREDLHNRVIKALKSDGVFILEAYTPEQLNTDAVGGPSASQLDKFMTAKGLKIELSTLDIKLCQEIQREVQEGVRHQGMSAVVQFVGTKP